MKKTFSFLLSLLCVITVSCTLDQEDYKPNIILISVDDMGCSDLGCYGSEVETPNLDFLAENGLRFSNFYNTSKCFPSRASLITGLYARDCGYDKTYTNPLTNAVTLGEVLQTVGYRTYWSGKHHGLENPYERGFDHYFGLKDGACNHFNPGLQRPGEADPARKNSRRQWRNDSVIYHPYTPEEKDFYTTDYFTNYALDYIHEAKEMDLPFFLYLALTAPHDPLMAWPEDIKKYSGKYDGGYEPIREKRFEKQLQMGLINERFILSEEEYTPWDSLSLSEQQFESQKMEVYAAMIDRIDQNIGRIIDHLEELKLYDNTLLMFVSDNGASSEMVRLKTDDDLAPVGSMGRWISLGKNWANVSNTPFRMYKNYSFEGGINTPMIAHWPKHIAPNSFSNFPGHFIDFMATLVDLTGAEYPKTFKEESIVPMRGVSLLPIFEGEAISRQKPLFWEWGQGQAMRHGDFKIVRHGKTKDWDLYDLKNDPTETLNLAQENPQQVVIMDSLFSRWQNQL